MFGAPPPGTPPPHSRATALWVAAELAVLAVGLAAMTAITLFTTPDGLHLVANRIVGDAPVTLDFSDVAPHPGARWWSPSTWRIVVHDLRVTPDDPLGPVVTARWLVLGTPDVARAWATRVLAIDAADVYGLRVHQRRQRPGPDWAPEHTALNALHIGTLRVFDASTLADADAPLPETEVTAIYGTVTDAVYAPGTRLLSATGALTASHFRSGGIAVDQVATTASATNGHLTFDATFALMGGVGSMHGDIQHLERRGPVRLNAELRDVRVQDVVAASSGTTSPLRGGLTGHLTVFAGGDLPRGGGRMETTVRLTDGRVLLGTDVRPFTRDLIRVAPWIQLGDDNDVILGPADADLQISRSGVTIKELRYQAPHRLLTLRGDVTEAGVDLILRFVPETNAHLRPGVGLHLTGRPPAIKVRLARREDLLPDGPPSPRRARRRAQE